MSVVNNLRSLVGQVCRVGAVGAVIAVVTMTAVFVVNLAVFSQGQDRVRAALARAIDDGSFLEARNSGPVPGLSFAFSREKNVGRIHRHDCLLWTSLIAPVPDLLTRVLRTPRLEFARGRTDARAPENPDCQAVLQALAVDAPPEARPTIVLYERYMLAQRALAQMLLSHFSLQASATIVKAVTFSAFGLVLVLAWRRQAFAICAIAALFLSCYGLGHFGGMLYFAPLDVTHALVLLLAVYRPFGTMPTGHLLFVGATYGSLVAIFEILTGGIPLALVIISILAGLSARDQGSFWRCILLLMGSFAVALVGCFALQLVGASFHSGDNAFARHFGQLFHRLRGDFLSEADPYLVERLSHYATDSRLLSVLYLLIAYAYWSLLIGWGSSIFGVILVMAGVTSLVIATVVCLRHKKDFDERLQLTLTGCWLAVGVAIAWVLLFWNHTLVHAFFMARPLLFIPLLCGAVAATEALRTRRLPQLGF